MRKTGTWLSRSLIACIVAIAALIVGGTNARAGEVEVLHFWTSPGEAQAIAQLKALIAERGHTWKDFAVVGGGGGNAGQALRVRVAAGAPPAAAAMKGPEIQEWAAQGVLTNLDMMAAFDHWDEVIPQELRNLVKYRGHYVAVPVNVHRANWLWANMALLRRAGIPAMPADYDAFFAAADKLRSAGVLPVAIGAEPWQEFVLFDDVALGVGGADFYRSALIQLDPATINSATMARVLQTFRRIKSYTDTRGPDQSWNRATAQLIAGKAAFQFMGDWAKGEFTTAGLSAGTDFVCEKAPGTALAFDYVVDTFAMFQLRNWEAQRAQGYLAYVLMGERFQHDFNIRKGSIPVRKGISPVGFDSCALTSMRDFDASARSGQLVPSVAIDMALPTDIHAQVQGVVSGFWEDDRRSVDDAIRRLLAIATERRNAR